MKIGVLAIQGSVIEHKKALEELGAEVIEVRLADDLNGVVGLILPGGESTAQARLMKRFGLFDEVRKFAHSGKAVWGTCAGAILLAKSASGKNPPDTLGVMNITADRNAYGGQLDSVESDIDFNGKSFRSIFIRAPKIRPLGGGVKTLATVNGEPVALREGNMFATSFHPELTDDTRVHEYFLRMCR